METSMTFHDFPLLSIIFRRFPSDSLQNLPAVSILNFTFNFQNVSTLHIQKAQKIDNRIAERISEKKSAYGTTSLPLSRKPLITSSVQSRPAANDGLLLKKSFAQE